MAATDEEIMAYLQGAESPEVINNNDIPSDSNESNSDSDILNYLNTPEKKIETPETEREYNMFESVNQWAAGANSVVADILGIPGNIESVFRDEGEQTVLPQSEYYQDKMADLGLTYRPGEEPDTAAYKGGEYTGIGLTFLAPMLHIGKAAQGIEAMGSVGKEVAKTLTKPFVQAPKRALAMEVAASTASGVGAKYGKDEYGQTGEVVGGLAGGLGVSAIPGAAKSIARAPYIGKSLSYLSDKTKAITDIFPAKTVASFLRDNLSPNTPTTTKLRVGDVLRETSEQSVNKTLKTIAETEQNIIPSAVGKITTGKLANDKHLIALQKKAIDNDPVLAAQIAARQEEVNLLARQELENMRPGTPISETKADIQGKVEQTVRLIEKQVDDAIEKSVIKSSSLAERQPFEKTANDINKNINSAMRVARDNEDEAWSNVSKDITTDISGTKSNFINMVWNLEKTADKELLPKFVYDFLGNIKNGKFKDGELLNVESVRDIHKLRSRINKVIRTERGEKSVDWDKIRVLDDIQAGLLSDISKSGAGKEYQRALGVSKQLNQDFRGGIVGRLLGYDRESGYQSPGIVMQGIGEKSKLADNVLKLISADPRTYSQIEELLKANIATSRGVMSAKGRVNPDGVKLYLKKNEEAMKMFPKLRDDLYSAALKEKEAMDATIKGKSSLAKLKQSVVNKYAYSDPETGLNNILKGNNPEKEMETLLKYSGPELKSGIKDDVISLIIGKSESGGINPDTYFKEINGRKIGEFWRKNKSTLSKPLSKPEIKRLEQVIETLTKNQLDEGIAASSGEAIKPRLKILEYFARRFAAVKGAESVKGTGGELQAASRASTVAKNIVNKFDTTMPLKLLKDTISDKELFDAVMSSIKTPMQVKKVDHVISSWITANIVDQLKDDSEEEGLTIKITTPRGRK